MEWRIYKLADSSIHLVGVCLCLLVTSGQGNITQLGPCLCETDQGLVDLTPLTDGQSPKFTVTFSSDTYFYSPCNSFTVAGVAGCTDVAACQLHDKVYYAIGTLDSARFQEDTAQKALKLSYSADGGRENRTSEVTLQCDSSIEATLIPQGEIEPGKGNFAFTLKSKFACAISRTGLSTGSILCIVFFVLVAVYLIGGIIYKFFIQGARGVETIPNLDTWKETPGLIVDGANFLAGKIKRPNAQYEQI